MDPQDDGTPVVRYTSNRQLYNLIDRIEGDYFTLTDVSPADLQRIDRGRERRRLRFRIRPYDSGTGVIHIALIRQPRQVLYLQLDQLIRHEVYDSLPGAGVGAGEADTSGCPVPARLGPGLWPTLVIESGCSQPLLALQRDMRWWFSASNYQVKIVLLVKLNRTDNSISIERWQEELSRRSGATMTQRNPIVEPTLQQSITITQRAGNPVSYNITGGALVLPFRLLFLRDPSPQEGDLVVGIPKLRVFAERVFPYVS
ncbi:hypothetical protein HJFPF1_05185 [Paramyrothecium foliicola]|nr:hypothetical protein HJFPF1_05185 [Paramyrothecium foliicola]